jgi:hypothetical protein
VQALSSIHSNPATALAAVPVAAMPVLYRSVRGGVEVTPDEQEEVSRLLVLQCVSWATTANSSLAAVAEHQQHNSWQCQKQGIALHPQHAVAFAFHWISAGTACFRSTDTSNLHACRCCASGVARR